MKKKVLVIVPDFSSYLFLREFCIALCEKGWSVHVAASGNLHEQYQVDTTRITFHKIGFPRGMNPMSHLVAASELRKLVGAVEPDLIDVHFSAAVFTVALSKLNSWPKILATAHGLRFPLATGVGKVVFRLAERWSCNRVDQFMVLNKEDFDALVAAGGRNCYLQPGFGIGCDLDRFDKGNSSEAQRMRTASLVGKLDNEVVLIFIGRLVAFKGFHLAVRSFIEAHKKNSRLRLLICGEYDNLHPSGLTEEEKVELGNHPNIFMVGWTPDVRDFLAISDFVVFPSEREGMPVNLMEALSMGIPVITSDSRGCREVMNASKHGIMLKEGSVEQLSKAIEKMAIDAAFRMAAGNAAMQFRHNFDRMSYVEEHVKRIESVC